MERARESLTASVGRPIITLLLRINGGHPLLARETKPALPTPGLSLPGGRFWKLLGDFVVLVSGGMQEFGPLTGRVFGGGWAAAQHQRQQPAKCPRCESTDTKFCYYNNYNLAQPRHYCKSCRRHWTKGGVLRNVPVGGGCRKSKRASSSSSSSKPHSQPSSSDDPSESHSDRLRRPVSVPSDLSKDNSEKAAVPLLVPTPPDPPFKPVGLPPCPPPEIFPNPPATGFGFPDPPMAEAKAASESTRPAAFADQAVPADPTPRDGAVVLSSGTFDPQLFDLATAADPAAYWNHSHWMDGDPTLYLP